jgi:hypothetical protein
MQRWQSTYFAVGGEAVGAGSVGGNDVAPVVQQAIVHAHQRSAVPRKDGILDPLQDQGWDSEGQVCCLSKSDGV